MRVLIGEISSYKAIVIATYLKRTYKDVIIISYDNNKLTKYIRTRFSDKHYYLFKPSLDEYILALSMLCKNESIDLFLPVHSNYIGEIIKKKELFGACLSYCGDYDNYILLHDKLNFYSIAKKANVPVPVHYENIETAIVPFVAKPKNKSSSKGVLYINTEKEKSLLLKEIRLEYLYQNYVQGKGCGYSVFAKEGKILVGYGHVRLLEYPVSGGSSIYREGYFVKEMRTYIDQILKIVKWSGFAMFEFKLTPDNELILIEANPRIWGSINQGLQNGINYFKYLIPYDATEPEIKRETRTYLSPQIYFSFLQYIGKGHLHPIYRFYKNRKMNYPDVSMKKDFKGWLSILTRTLHL